MFAQAAVDPSGLNLAFKRAAAHAEGVERHQRKVERTEDGPRADRVSQKIAFAAANGARKKRREAASGGGGVMLQLKLAY